MVSATNNKLRPVELIATVQNYDWGIRGDESLVAQIYAANAEQEITDQEKPFAEVGLL